VQPAKIKLAGFVRLMRHNVLLVPSFVFDVKKMRDRLIITAIRGTQLGDRNLRLSPKRNYQQNWQPDVAIPRIKAGSKCHSAGHRMGQEGEQALIPSPGSVKYP